MYKCVDEKGKTTYAETMRPGCKRVDIQGSPPISGRVQDGSRNAASEEADFRRRQMARERAEENEKHLQAEEARRCAAVRNDIGRLSSGRIIERYSESGERIYMDDQTREQRL